MSPNIKKGIKNFIVGLLMFATSIAFVPSETTDNLIGTSFSADNKATWYDFKSFSGYQTNIDPASLTDGANPTGQNTTVNNGDRVGVRKSGYEVFPEDSELSTSTDPIKSLYVFRKRGGESIMIRTSTTTVEYFEENNDSWTTIKTGLTASQRFGFATYNINTDLQSYVYFGNKTDNAMRWTGVSGILSSSLNINDSSISVTNVDEDEGFILATGTIIVCDQELEYSSYDQVTGVFSLTVPSTTSCAAGNAVAEAVEELPGLPKGDIYLSTNNRLFISGIASSSQAVYFSEYGDATNFVGADLVTNDTDTSPGIFNLGEGGGPITGLVEDEDSIYIFKKTIIRKATLSDTLYTLTTLKAFDGKSQTTGSISSNGLFASGNKVFFVTSDNQIMSLGRVESIDTPQITAISETIQPTINAIDFSNTSGIVFKNIAYFQGASDGSSVNNVVFVRNLNYNFWDSPIVGWNPSQFVVYDDGNGEALYFSDASLKNVYKVTDNSSDADGNILANWRSKQYDFGAKSIEKDVVDVYVEGYIKDNTQLYVNLLVDEDGFTQKFSTSITGNTTTYLYTTTDYNPFGLSPFGIKRFGTSDEVSEMKKFRVYLGKELRVQPFYNLQIEFLSDGSGQAWEVTNYGFKVRANSEETKRTLYKSFKQ